MLFKNCKILRLESWEVKELMSYWIGKLIP